MVQRPETAMMRPREVLGSGEARIDLVRDM